MEFGNNEMYKLALKQKRFVDGRYTLTVRGWNPDINLFVDAPWISSGGEGDAEILSADRSLASLLLANSKENRPTVAPSNFSARFSHRNATQTNGIFSANE